MVKQIRRTELMKGVDTHKNIKYDAYRRKGEGISAVRHQQSCPSRITATASDITNVFGVTKTRRPADCASFKRIGLQGSPSQSSFMMAAYSKASSSVPKPNSSSASKTVNLNQRWIMSPIAPRRPKTDRCRG